MDTNKKSVGMSFDEMFGDAQEFIPNPTDIVEGEFAALDEEDAGGEDELEDVDCTDIVPSDEVVSEDTEDDFDFYDEDEDEDDEDDSEDEDTGEEEPEDDRLGGLE